MLRNILDGEFDFKISASLDEYEHYLDLQDRRLYLTSAIDDSCFDFEMPIATQIVDNILRINREDRAAHEKGAEVKPIRLYINSPGGDIVDGFSVVGAIAASKTPVWTINIGQWSSMAFLIGITGHRRLSLPNMTFLMHDGTNYVFSSTTKAQDKMEFDKRFEDEAVKAHVLGHSRMTAEEYDKLVRVEYYMLPKDAMKHGFIDEIVEDITTIL